MDRVGEVDHAQYNHTWELLKVSTDAMGFLNPLMDMIFQANQTQPPGRIFRVIVMIILLKITQMNYTGWQQSQDPHQCG